jgi:phage shock protein PspC (stress-responsive transcriptional regulator)
MIAGVCGGLGRHLDIDPVVFRILFALLTSFGGFGLLVYAAAWLFVPEENEDESEGHKLLWGGRGPFGAIAVAVLIAVGFMVMLTVLDHDFWHAVPLLLLAAAIVAVTLWLGESTRRRPPGGEQQQQGGWGWGPNGPAGGPDQPQPWWQRPVPGSPGSPTATPGTGPGTEPGAAGSAPGEPSDVVHGSGDAGSSTAPFMSGTGLMSGTGQPSFGETGFGPNAGFVPGPGLSPDWGTGAGNAGFVEPKPRNTPRRVGGLVLSGALLALGIVGVLAETGAISISWSAGFALAVMAVGAGMIIGGLFGRARLLIPLGLVLSVPLILATAIGVPLRGQTGDTTWTPVSAAAVTSPYDLAAGRGSLDLSSVNPNGGTVHVTAYVGAGQLIVTVPDNVSIVVTAHVGVGRMQFTDGTRHSGLDVTKTFSAYGSGPSKGTIVLDLKAGAGDVEVQRVS